MSQHSSRTTTNHDEIRRWAEARGAKPACVKGTGGNGDPGMIRLDFPGYSGGDSLRAISWDEWFRAFDENGLALVYQEQTAEGERSNFNKLVARDTSGSRDHESSRSSHSGGHSASRSSDRGSHNEATQHASGSRDSSDLKSREYRDAQGEIHHHTHPYMEEHRGDGRGKSGD